MAGLLKQAKRSWRRLESRGREAVIHGSPPWLRRSLGQPARYLDMLLVDHGIFRFVYANCHKLSDKAWRSAQPAPHHFRRFADAGIRTIVNLRGPRQCGSYWLEEEACARHGLKLVNFRIGSRAAPTREDLLGAERLFNEIEYPMLMHCKSGADRAGLMGALYRILHEGRPVEEAVKQLSWRYGHMRQAKVGMIDYFFEQYRRYNGETPTPFLDWVDRIYDPAAVKSSFMSQWWANLVVDKILRRE
jgi:protein tyrosine phosphatase (PTP) superfamily phosphohydrolase (DUF442 family)